MSHVPTSRRTSTFRQQAFLHFNISSVRRVQSASFDLRVTVYPADDYDRRGSWMHAAVDRMRFTRRIEQTELILAPVLNDVHRATIRMSRLKLCDV